jgi:hypothetical protein
MADLGTELGPWEELRSGSITLKPHPSRFRHDATTEALRVRICLTRQNNARAHRERVHTELDLWVIQWHRLSAFVPPTTRVFGTRQKVAIHQAERVRGRYKT